MYSSQTPCDPSHLLGNAAPWQLDCPAIDGGASLPLKQWLAACGVSEMEVIMGQKGYNTLESYLSLANKPEERAIILTQRRQLYNIVLNLPAMQYKLDRICGDVLGGVPAFRLREHCSLQAKIPRIRL
jgi:hypothetical protein